MKRYYTRTGVELKLINSPPVVAKPVPKRRVIKINFFGLFEIVFTVRQKENGKVYQNESA